MTAPADAAQIARIFDIPVELLGQPTTYQNYETREGGDDMAFKKFGTGEITETEKTNTAKTAAKQGEWTDSDDKDLARENAEADRKDA